MTANTINSLMADMSFPMAQYSGAQRSIIDESQDVKNKVAMEVKGRREVV